MTKLEVAKLVARLMACFPGQQFPPGTVAAYEHYLISLDHERAQQAIDQVVKASRFLPTIAEIVSAYDALAPRKPEATYRLFRPKPVERPMSPSELKSEIDKALEAMK